MAIKVTKPDRRTLDALRAELDDPSISEERRDELEDDYASIAQAYYIADILEDEPTAQTAASPNLTTDPASLEPRQDIAPPAIQSIVIGSSTNHSNFSHLPRFHLLEEGEQERTMNLRRFGKIFLLSIPAFFLGFAFVLAVTEITFLVMYVSWPFSTRDHITGEFHKVVPFGATLHALKDFVCWIAAGWGGGKAVGFVARNEVLLGFCIAASLGLAIAFWIQMSLGFHWTVWIAIPLGIYLGFESGINVESSSRLQIR